MHWPVQALVAILTWLCKYGFTVHIKVDIIDSRKRDWWRDKWQEVWCGNCLTFDESHEMNDVSLKCAPPPAHIVLAEEIMCYAYAHPPLYWPCSSLRVPLCFQVPSFKKETDHQTLNMITYIPLQLSTAERSNGKLL